MLNFKSFFQPILIILASTISFQALADINPRKQDGIEMVKDLGKKIEPYKKVAEQLMIKSIDWAIKVENCSKNSDAKKIRLKFDSLHESNSSPGVLMIFRTEITNTVTQEKNNPMVSFKISVDKSGFDNKYNIGYFEIYPVDMSMWTGPTKSSYMCSSKKVEIDEHTNRIYERKKMITIKEILNGAKAQKNNIKPKTAISFEPKTINNQSLGYLGLDMNAVSSLLGTE
ncbi:hypothetical protein [Leucothrix arctica]|uniref:DUF4352 domain-containing protein n=1 Tax=Leucothrix arctica TaxID=1481894 RepID=A0A317CE22_9GAMM|nr:hypothetical protein [Leucothrix arctica]PWQ96786.1 hypothetical protein DKT75_08440 [Leucothrix arctica]